MTPPGVPTATLHATCILLAASGVLIRGSSGSGKSTLAQRLVEAAGLRGDHAAHVADDRVVVSAWHGRLVAEPHPAIAGRVEVRGLGLMPVAHASAAVLRLIVDLEEATPRLPDPGTLKAVLLGIELPSFQASRRDAAELVLWRLRGRDDTLVTIP